MVIREARVVASPHDAASCQTLMRLLRVSTVVVLRRDAHTGALALPERDPAV
jgi:hypothetical protein